MKAKQKSERDAGDLPVIPVLQADVADGLATEYRYPALLQGTDATKLMDPENNKEKIGFEVTLKLVVLPDQAASLMQMIDARGAVMITVQRMAKDEK